MKRLAIIVLGTAALPRHASGKRWAQGLDLEEAIARYGAALELHPALVAARYNRGLDLMNAGRLQEALASFDRAIQLHAIASSRG